MRAKQRLPPSACPPSEGHLDGDHTEEAGRCPRIRCSPHPCLPTPPATTLITAVFAGDTQMPGLIRTLSVDHPSKCYGNTDMTRGRVGGAGETWTLLCFHHPQEETEHINEQHG